MTRYKTRAQKALDEWDLVLEKRGRVGSLRRAMLRAVERYKTACEASEVATVEADETAEREALAYALGVEAGARQALHDLHDQAKREAPAAVARNNHDFTIAEYLGDEWTTKGDRHGQS